MTYAQAACLHKSRQAFGLLHAELHELDELVSLMLQDFSALSQLQSFAELHFNFA